MTDLGLPGGVNPLDFLHKLATQRGLPRPDFAQVGEQGLPHNKVFVWQCSFYQVVAQGSGRSKKEAKVAAQSRKQTKNKSPVHVVHYQHCITGAKCKNITFEQTNETSENRLIFF